MRWYIHDYVLRFLKISVEQADIHLIDVRTEYKKSRKSNKLEKRKKSRAVERPKGLKSQIRQSKKEELEKVKPRKTKTPHRHIQI